MNVITTPSVYTTTSPSHSVVDVDVVTRATAPIVNRLTVGMLTCVTPALTVNRTQMVTTRASADPDTEVSFHGNWFWRNFTRSSQTFKICFNYVIKSNHE